MSFIFEWSPEEWKDFTAESKERAERILADENLFKIFDECLMERRAIAEENGCRPEDFPMLETTLDIIWRNNFV